MTDAEKLARDEAAKFEAKKAYDATPGFPSEKEWVSLKAHYAALNAWDSALAYRDASQAKATEASATGPEFPVKWASDYVNEVFKGWHFPNDDVRTECEAEAYNLVHEGWAKRGEVEEVQRGKGYEKLILHFNAQLAALEAENKRLREANAEIERLKEKK